MVVTFRQRKKFKSTHRYDKLNNCAYTPVLVKVFFVVVVLVLVYILKIISLIYFMVSEIDILMKFR